MPKRLNPLQKARKTNLEARVRKEITGEEARLVLACHQVMQDWPDEHIDFQVAVALDKIRLWIKKGK